MKYFVKLVMAKISGPKDTHLGDQVYLPLWLVNQDNLPKTGCRKFFNFTDALTISVFIPRVDFMPSPKGWGGNPNDLKCCPRCGCNVYEAEKLIAAGRVKMTITISTSIHFRFIFRRGISAALRAQNVIGLWIRRLSMMDLMGTFIAKVATLRNLVWKATDLDRVQAL